MVVPDAFRFFSLYLNSHAYSIKVHNYWSERFCKAEKLIFEEFVQYSFLFITSFLFDSIVCKLCQASFRWKFVLFLGKSYVTRTWSFIVHWVAFGSALSRKNSQPSLTVRLFKDFGRSLLIGKRFFPSFRTLYTLYNIATLLFILLSIFLRFGITATCTMSDLVFWT